MRFLLSITLIAMFSISLGGCIVYKQDIQQGNEITQEMVSQLNTGMTKREVTRILGSPLINDPFHNNRWDYYFSLKDGKTGKVSQATATLTFEGDTLTAIDSSF